MNSLRVDVILESEQRSTSPVSIKAALKIMGGLVIALIIGGVLFYILRAKSAERRLGEISAEWQMKTNVVDRVRQDTNTLHGFTCIKNEFESWKKARIVWHEHLEDFRALTPTNVQITSFQVEEVIDTEKGNNSARKFTLNLQGRAEGQNPGVTVGDFRSALKNGAGFSNMVEKADVIKIDTVPGDKSNHRVFTIVVKYVKRPF